MDMHNLKFPNNSFDVIFACHSLEHGNEPRKYVNEIVRCLKSDGILIFEVPVDFKKNTRKDGEVVFDKTPRFSGDVDIIDFENVELFNSIMLKSASTKILKSKKIKTTQPKPKAQGNLKAVIKIAKEK
jgi:SAM-dependent methyltransferase